MKSNININSDPTNKYNSIKQSCQPINQSNYNTDLHQDSNNSIYQHSQNGSKRPLEHLNEENGMRDSLDRYKSQKHCADENLATDLMHGNGAYNVAKMLKESNDGSLGGVQDVSINREAINDFTSIIANSDTRNELVVNNLLITSNYFLNKAHEVVLHSSTIQGSNTYFKLIKISIKALLLLIRKYGKCLNPYLELIIYFKLARIYFTETSNLNRADDYVNKAMSIAVRNNFVTVKFVCEFLTAQILEKSNLRLSVNYLNEKIKSSNLAGLSDIANIFALLKINNLLSQDPSTSLIVLQSLCNSSLVDDITKSLCFIYQCNLHLYRGSVDHSKQLLTIAEKILLDTDLKYPIQLKAMLYLTKFSVCVRTDDRAESKKTMQLISNFILEEQTKHWNSWEEDGAYNINLVIPLTNNLNTELSYKVLWLNSDEFVIMFYFLTGVSFLSDVYNLKSKAKKVFQKCLEILNKQLEDLKNFNNISRKFSLDHLTKKIMRLNYIRYYVQYYQVWMNFLQKDFKNVDPLNEFLENYNNNKFTNEELCYYQLLIPKIIYLFGICFQYAGDLKAAKYYYLRARNLTLHKQELDKSDERISILQSYLGIGGQSFQSEGEFSELYIFSTFHLLMITEFEVDMVAKLLHHSKKIMYLRDETCKLRTSLYLDLNNIFSQKDKKTSNSFNMNEASSSEIFKMTYSVLLSVYGSSYQEKDHNKSDTVTAQDLVNLLTNTTDSSGLINSFTYMVSLIFYISYCSAATLLDKESSMQRCLELISKENSSDNEKIVSCIILKDYHAQLMEQGNHDKSDMIETQLRYLHDQLKNKFAFIDTYI